MKRHLQRTTRPSQAAQQAEAALRGLGANPADLTLRDEANVITYQTFRLVLEDFHQWLTDEDMRAINVASSALLSDWLAKRDGMASQEYRATIAALKMLYTSDWEQEKETWPVDNPGGPCPSCKKYLRPFWKFCPNCGRPHSDA